MASGKASQGVRGWLDHGDTLLCDVSEDLPPAEDMVSPEWYQFPLPQNATPSHVAVFRSRHGLGPTLSSHFAEERTHDTRKNIQGILKSGTQGNQIFWFADGIAPFPFRPEARRYRAKKATRGKGRTLHTCLPVGGFLPVQYSQCLSLCRGGGLPPALVVGQPYLFRPRISSGPSSEATLPALHALTERAFSFSPLLPLWSTSDLTRLNSVRSHHHFERPLSPPRQPRYDRARLRRVAATIDSPALCVLRSEIAPLPPSLVISSAHPP
ncbi:hypothetical protein EV126DRAFT_71673 [Verticillium dahliae]|nr:hypothetical protein EV126DRAFT_71673 [Verticillium dahliae]